MKRMFFLFLVFISAMLFTSCIDSMQSVSFKDGQYEVTARFTMSKDTLQSLQSLAELSDEGYSNDWNEMFESVASDFPRDGRTMKIDTETDFGVQYTARANKTSYEFREYIPKRYANAMTLELESNSSEEIGEWKEFLSGYKHRIYIAKNILKELKTVQITDEDFSGKNLAFYDIGEMWCIEVPWSVLAEKDYRYIVMYF